jgi:hypothetical protein
MDVSLKALDWSLDIRLVSRKTRTIVYLFIWCGRGEERHIV